MRKFDCEPDLSELFAPHIRRNVIRFMFFIVVGS